MCRQAILVLVLALALSPLPTGAATHVAAPVNLPLSAQGPYMVQQLQAYSDSYWSRVAGRDTDLPPKVNGHDEFAARWTREMLAALNGLPVGLFRQPFATPGFQGLPASRPGVNLVVAVPGARRADRAVIVGAHYDGEAISKGSAYDDTSGCMIMLALARDLGALWRRDGLPSLTVEFVLFDGEEQGLIGSTAYSFAYKHAALMPRPALMIDEEQSGAGYPARPFGLLSDAPMPGFALTTGRVSGRTAQLFGGAVAPDKAAVQLLVKRLTAARRTVFEELHTVYPSLDFRGGSAPVFLPAEERYLHIETDVAAGCCSDNGPFEALGLPTAMFSGDFTYYNRNPPSWAFPYDQPQDTVQALACDTGGAPIPGRAFEAALDLPLALSETLIGTYAPPARGAGIAVFSTVPGAGSVMQLSAAAPAPVRWSFGDGARAAGNAVTHVYAHPGTYLLTARAGAAHASWHVVVRARQPVFLSLLRDLRVPPLKPWHPGELQDLPGCH